MQQGKERKKTKTKKQLRFQKRRRSKTKPNHPNQGKNRRTSFKEPQVEPNTSGKMKRQRLACRFIGEYSFNVPSKITKQPPPQVQ